MKWRDTTTGEGKSKKQKAKEEMKDDTALVNLKDTNSAALISDR